MAKDWQIGGECTRQPSSDTCVIFIHGIISDGEQAWMSGTDTTWPKLLAAESVLYSIGIYTFSYRSDVFSRTYSIGDVVDSIREFFNLDDLWKVHRIIFVCHSTGGIAARRFIVVNQTKFIERGSELGLFLVASPSLGSKDANALAIFARLIRSTQADALRFSQSNTWLNDLDKDFMNLKESRKLSIIGKELIEDETIKIKNTWACTHRLSSRSRPRGILVNRTRCPTRITLTLRSRSMPMRFNTGCSFGSLRT